MRKVIINFLIGASVSLVLASKGIHATNWQWWTIYALLGAILINNI